MDTPTRKLHPLAWVAGIAVVLFCGLGIAAIMGWLPSSKAKDEAQLANNPPPVTAPATAAPHHEATHHTHHAASRTEVAALSEHERTAAPVCLNCGVVESVHEVVQSGQATGLGAVGGAVVGGVLGHQIGGGTGKEIATVAGAIGGGYAGNAIEKKMKTTQSYEIVVRLNDGNKRIFHEATQPDLHEGEHVRVVNDHIEAM